MDNAETGLCSSITSSNATRVTPGCICAQIHHGQYYSCLNEINRLRAASRPDLKPYPLPAPPKPARKHKLTGSGQRNELTPKKPCGANPGPLGTSNTGLPNKALTKRKRTESAKPRAEQPAKKAHSASDTDVVFLFQEPDLPYKFHSVNELWQRNICDFMSLRFRSPNKVTQGGPNVPLGPPDPSGVARTQPMPGHSVGTLRLRVASYPGPPSFKPLAVRNAEETSGVWGMLP